MLHKAIYWQLIVSNPAERVQPPKAKKPKRRYYDDEQCKVLLENLTDDDPEKRKELAPYLVKVGFSEKP